MSLNELVDFYNQRLNSNSSGSTIGTDPSHHTPQSTFTINTGFDSIGETRNNDNITYTQSATSSLLFEAGQTRFQLNDRVLAGEIVRPPPHNQPRIERIKHVDKIEFSSGDNDIHDYENNPEYTTKYPDVKPQLNIINAQQAKIPPIDMYTNPGEQIQKLIHQGKLKDLHGYINYPYNYIEPPWHFSPLEAQQGYVNLQPPRTHYTAKDIELNQIDDFNEIQLPNGVPQQPISQDRYEIIPLPKMVYENFVPLIATRRIVCRQQKSKHVSNEEASLIASQLPQIEEMTFNN